MILCPWLDGPEPATRFWLGVLSWHDANAGLLAAIGAGGRRLHLDNVFAGLFCVDPFRGAAPLLERLRGAGIGGIVNLPSVTFLDGPIAGILRQFELGPERELRFLRQAREAGFRVAGCVTDQAMAEELAGMGGEFAIVHNGPPLTKPARGRDESSAALLRRFGGFGLPVVPIPTLLQTL